MATDSAHYIVQIHTEGIAVDRDRITLFKYPTNALNYWEKKVREYRGLGVQEDEDRFVKPNEDESDYFGRAVFTNSDETETEITVTDIHADDE